MIKSKKKSLIIKDLFKNGYTIVENILTKKECNKLIVDIERVYEKEKKNPFYFDELTNKGQIIIRDLIFKKPKTFLNIIDKKFVMNLLSNIFKDVFILDNVMASNSNNVGDKYSTLVHMDAHLPNIKYSNTADIIAFFCLDDFTKDNGSTKIWPGSHRTGIRIQNSKDYKRLIKKKAIYLNAKKGSCVFILGQTWHQVGNNINSKRRWGIFTHYKRWWIKPSTDFTKCGPKIYKLLNSQQKELLGFNSISPKFNFKKQTKNLRTLRKVENLSSNYKKVLNY
jgi:ectoine hydroxylase-related dioxygenase (phytanoyl-CoA dioxygenase family)